MRNNKVIGTLAGVVALGSICGLVLSITSGLGPHTDRAPAEAVGRILARQTLALLKPGGHVTVITRDTLFFENPATDYQFSSFRKALAQAGVKLDSIQALQIDPLRPVAVPAGDFFQWIKKSARGDVVVSLMGPPMLNETQLAQLGEIKPSIIAFCSGSIQNQVDLRSLFSQGLLHAAVVSKRSVPAKAAVPGSEREIFERQFLEVTAANVAASNLSP
jgi:hypothetical protein